MFFITILIITIIGDIPILIIIIVTIIKCIKSPQGIPSGKLT